MGTTGTGGTAGGTAGGAAGAAAVRARAAVLGRGEVPAHAPALRADDAGAARGDGCFETLRVLGRAGAGPLVQHLEAHLERLAASCAAMDLPVPDRAAWRALAALLSDGVPAGAEAVLRLAVTRGAPGAGPTGVATLAPVPPALLRQRAEGVRAVVLTTGTDARAHARAPWLLGGVKHLSYALNAAALREAARRGADDAVLVDVRGLLLEAPTASLVWSCGGELRTPRTAGTGVLPGTVQRAVFAAAGAEGVPAREVDAGVADLLSADAAWLTSSVRGVVELTALDGAAPARDAALSARVRRWAGF
ncbi:aminotransferase class IV [Kineococcus gypseus]|uniref:aminotransferase class IV n=1 Tax=Kineococcus gypseus TaxID=1637102 RepID=UPI003D7D7F48